MIWKVPCTSARARPRAWASRSKTNLWDDEFRSFPKHRNSGAIPCVGGGTPHQNHREDKMPKHGKKYLEAAKLIEHGHYYSPEEAVALVKQTHFAEFDATVELHLRTGLDPRHADQQVRGVVLLPSGTGKRVSILVFAEGDGDRIARAAGPEYVGSDDLVHKRPEGW